MDGVGKTTHALKLYEKLRREGFSCVYFHMPGYTSKAFPARFSPKNVNRALRILWSLATLADYVITYAVRLKPLARSSIVICDRYFYHKLEGLISDKVLNDFIARIYLRLIPRPDEVFLLDAPPEYPILRRDKGKKIGTLNYYKRQRRSYLWIASQIKPSPIIIDTRKPISETCETIFRYVLHMKP
jgi:thymidylate kinase